jgi:integrase
VDLVGKGGHVRTVPMPAWVKDAVDRWKESAKVTAGRIFRAVSRHGTPWGKGISENVIWYVVRRVAERIQLDHLAPHDLRSYAEFRTMPNRNLRAPEYWVILDGKRECIRHFRGPSTGEAYRWIGIEGSETLEKLGNL